MARARQGEGGVYDGLLKLRSIEIDRLYITQGVRWCVRVRRFVSREASVKMKENGGAQSKGVKEDCKSNDCQTLKKITIVI